MHFPTWVDLKGQDAVPETVHHVVNITFFFTIHSLLYVFSYLVYREIESTRTVNGLALYSWARLFTTYFLYGPSLLPQI